jgi:uncharacterized protein
MSSPLSHFALNADDVPASRAFYESVFGWTFEAWGPPGFYRIATGGEHAVEGALQQRRELVPGAPTRGVECTFAVDDVAATLAAVRTAGGVVLMERFTISGVGHLAFFADPSGNPIGAMQYDPDAA